MKISDALQYDPDTGIITWKVGRFTHVKDKEAGWIEASGYRCIMFQGETYKAHRIAWLLHYGVPPVLFNTREEAYAAVSAAHKRIYGEFSPCK